jgi:hypothetical protein
MKPIGKWLTTCFLCGAIQASYAEVQVSVDRGSLTIDDTFVLTLKATAGEDLKKTNFSPLLQNFDAIDSRQENKLSIVNGQRQSTRALHITLVPKSSGRLVIPALNVDGFMTRPITLMVKNSSDDLNAHDSVFVEAEVDSQRVYVQSQLLFTYRIYRAIALTDMGYSGLDIDNATIEQLESANYVRNIDGTNYEVNELRFALFPQQSGHFEIPALEFTARQATRRRGFFDLGSQGKPLRRKSDPVQIQVLPIPDEYPNAPWLPSSDLLISEDWSAPPESMSIGDSTTRTITLKAQGLTGAQLPPVESPMLKGIKIYADQPKAENISSESGISALGVNSAAWVVTEGGEFDIPEVSIPWWDTDDKKVRYARVPARRLSIIAAPLPVSSTSAAQLTEVDANTALGPRAPDSHRLWQWATWAALGGWLLTTLVMWRWRRGYGEANALPAPAPEQTESARFKQLLAACRKNDALEARTSILSWAEILGGHPTPTVSQLQAFVDDSSLAQALAEMEQCLYAPSEQAWLGRNLAERLDSWRKAYFKERKKRGQSPLPPLYSS